MLFPLGIVEGKCSTLADLLLIE